MSFVTRKGLVLAGLMAIVLSFGLDGQFATDAVTPAPEPPSLARLATGGVIAIAAVLIRRKK